VIPAVPERLVRAAPAASDVLAWAPGRANLIGEYTDVADGFVLPVALEMRTWALGRSGGSRLVVRSLDEPGEVVVDLETGEGPTEGWGAYATGVVRALRDGGVQPEGFDGVIASAVPQGAGLSSSAALEVCVAMALLPSPPPPAELAQLCRRAENVYVGVQSGIMDQLSSVAGAKGQALLIDCRSLEVRNVPVPETLTVLVVDSGVRRSLTDGRYNEVRRDLDEAARLLGVPALRDVDEAQLSEAAGSGVLEGSVLRRARHVVGDNRRTQEAASALAGGRLDEVGDLFAESHRSLANDLGVSTPELDALVAIASATHGVIASRMTGAGFGGCTVNLVARERAASAADEIVAGFRRTTGGTARAWISRPGDGAGRSAWHA
jgi:galactokinase